MTENSNVVEVPNTSNQCMFCRRDFDKAEIEIRKYFAGLDDTSDAMKTKLMDERFSFHFDQGKYTLHTMLPDSYNIENLTHEDIKSDEVNEIMEKRKQHDIEPLDASLCVICGAVFLSFVEEMKRYKRIDAL